MAQAVIPFPKEPVFPGRTRAPRRIRLRKRIRWERLTICLCLLYLATFMGWGEVTDMRLRAETARLQNAVRQEQLKNDALKAQIQGLQGTSGEASAIQNQLGLVPPGEVRVIVRTGP